MNRRWICSDVWMDILPSFDRPQLGLKMALLSDRFDILVDKHFDGKKELTIWREILVCKDNGPKATLSERIDGKFVDFPFPDRPLPIKIRFKELRINYIDYSVIEFVRSNKQIWDRMGTKLELYVYSDKAENDQPIWDVLASEFWPIFAQNIRRLRFLNGHQLDNLLRRTSPTILTDLINLNSIESGALFPDVIADDGPNATAGQTLSKWLHTSSKNSQPKRLRCCHYWNPPSLEWVNNLKEPFLRATDSSVSYIIRMDRVITMPIEPFELVNERTEEKLTLLEGKDAFYLLLKRCPISEKATAVQWENDENSDDNLNYVRFELWHGNHSIGPFSPPTEEKQKADE